MRIIAHIIISELMKLRGGDLIDGYKLWLCDKDNKYYLETTEHDVYPDILPIVIDGY